MREKTIRKVELGFREKRGIWDRSEGQRRNGERERERKGFESPVRKGENWRPEDLPYIKSGLMWLDALIRGAVMGKENWWGRCRILWTGNSKRAPTVE